MREVRSLSRLVQTVAPGDALQRTVKERIFKRIEPVGVTSLVMRTTPSRSFAQLLKGRVLRDMVMARLRPLPGVHPIHGGLKWAAAFAVFILIIRSIPLILLAPAIRAEVGVQLIPGGEDVSVYAGGVWRTVESPDILHGATMIRTGMASATLILNDDGVFRLGPNTTLKLHDIADRPQPQSGGPTATIIRGQMWVLGLLAPVMDSLTLETSHGLLSVNVGSALIEDDGNTVQIAVYDRGVTFEHGKQIAFLVSGERVTVAGDQPFNIVSMPIRVFSETLVMENLSQDAVHSAEIARLQEERRQQMAGILPTSFLYPAKRIAERVDVLFTLTHDGRTEKRIQQADTRLLEAIALLKGGKTTEASAPLAEYRDSLVALASEEDDNLVKYLIKKQIADASTSLTAVPAASPDASVQLLKDAVLEVGAAIPDTDLKLRDIEGYVLVDTLAKINTMIGPGRDPESAAAEYAEIRPYIDVLLDEKTGAHPLLQKEAKSLLIATSVLLKEVLKENQNAVVAAMQTDVSQYLPPDEDAIFVSEEELRAEVQKMVERILLFRHPRSRYNQLLTEMTNLRGNPSRGTLLRRLKSALPDGLGEYVNTEIKLLSDELKGG